MHPFESLSRALDDAPTLDAALETLVEALAQRIKATSNDQNVQKLSRELRFSAPQLVAAIVSKQRTVAV